MNPALVIALSIAIVLASHFVPWFAGQKFGAGRGLAVGVVGLLLVLGSIFRVGNAGMLDLVALGLLVRGIVVHYRRYEEVRIEERGEAAIAAAEAQRK